MIIPKYMSVPINWFGKYNNKSTHRWPETPPHKLLGGRELMALANAVSVRIGANRVRILRIYDFAQRWTRFTGAPIIEVDITWYTETHHFTYEFDTIHPTGCVPLLDLVTAEVQKLPYEKVEFELLHQSISYAIGWRKVQLYNRTA